MLIVLIILLLLFIFFINTNETFFENTDIDLTNIKKITKIISINRPIESENLKNVKKYVIDKLNMLNLSVEEQTFTKNNHNFSNIIGINKNENKKYILLSAHIDSIKDDIEGTIDSATSIAIILEITKKLLIENPNFPLLIVFFDGEEAVDGPWSKDNTLFGSRYFVENNNYNIETAYILDLIGGDINKNKIAAFSNNLNSYKHIKDLYEINKSFNINIIENPDNYTSPNIIEDDHIPFKEQKINYIHLIPYDFPSSHHTKNDNYNNVNWKYVDLFSNILYKKLKKKNIY